MGFLSEFRNLVFLSPGILSLGILSVGILSAGFLSCGVFVGNPILETFVVFRAPVQRLKNELLIRSYFENLGF